MIPFTGNLETKLMKCNHLQRVHSMMRLGALYFDVF